MLPHPWSSYGMRGQNEYASGPALTVPAELTGYRRWTLRPDGLVGNWGCPWPTDTLDAVCLDKYRVEISRDEYMRLLSAKGAEVSAQVRDKDSKSFRVVYGEHIPEDAEEVVYSRSVVGRQHAAPHRNEQDKSDDCRCGIYAGYSISGLQETWVMSPSNSFIGVVKASGHTVCGRVGFRTARARIVALCVGLDRRTEALFHQGKVSAVFVDPTGSGRKDLLRAEGATTREQLAELVGKRARALAAFPQYAGVRLYDDINEMIRDFPPDDLRALGIGS